MAQRLRGRVAAGLLCAALCAGAHAQYTDRSSSPDAGRATPPRPGEGAASGRSVDSGKSIELKGERVCLRRHPDENGRILLDCAIGLRGDDDRFYGLVAASPELRQPFPVMNSRVLVRGMFNPGASSSYEIVGDIAYTSIQNIDEPKRVTGTFMCIEHGAPGAPADGCKPVIQTGGGLYWGLEERSLEEHARTVRVAPGTAVSVEGDIVSNVPEAWHPWAWASAPRRIEGVLLVRGLQGGIADPAKATAVP
jgi:hypothetical protein